MAGVSAILFVNASGRFNRSEDAESTPGPLLLSSPVKSDPKRSREWTAGYVSGRTEVLEQILAEDFVVTSPSGKTRCKSETIKSAKEAPSVLASATMDRVVVKVFDVVAIAFGEDILTFKAGTPAPLRNKWTPGCCVTTVG